MTSNVDVDFGSCKMTSQTEPKIRFSTRETGTWIKI